MDHDIRDIRLIQRHRRRVFRERVDFFELRNDAFVARFRLSKEAVRHLLDIIADDLEPGTGRSCSLSADMQVFVALLSKISRFSLIVSIKKSLSSLTIFFLDDMMLLNVRAYRKGYEQRVYMYHEI